ncbi:wax ester/triacylglycerol synthase family O-acyltransferase [Streptomyces sp. NPDC001282]|uniref:WS/DGAT/MGAT family O-acyltransferase n=1 Tax=Streptomyces sp. NPDC001282 TaxID=3364557 RepID=UPI0036C43721
MRQLSALDAQFLGYESDINVANIGGLSIADGQLSRGDLIELAKERCAVTPMLRQRLMAVPLGLDRPYWVEDEAVDLGYHVRELALPRPGNDQQLAELVAWLHEQRLDRRYPLWEVYVISGLRGRRAAVYVKAHHATVDGVGGAVLLNAFMDREPSPPRQQSGPSAQPDRVPPRAEILARSVAGMVALPARLTRSVVETVPYLDEIPLVSQLPGAVPVSRAVRSVTRRLAGLERVPELPSLAVPWTPFNGPISRHRRFAFSDLPLDEVKGIKNAFGVTVNDVIVDLAATAVRRWLIGHDALPDEPLVACVPFALRKKGAEETGNRVTVMLTSLETQIADPRERLQAIHEAMQKIKERFDLAPAQWLEGLCESVPCALTGLADRALFGLLARGRPAVNLTVSNVPGPQVPLYVCGRAVLVQYPVSLINDAGGGLNITGFSYNGELGMGIVADRAMVPDVWHIADYLHDALEELRSLVG